MTVVMWLVSVLLLKNGQTYSVVGDTPRGDANTVADVEARVLSFKVITA